MGRLLGIPSFLTTESMEDVRKDASDLRKAKKLDDDGDAFRRVQIAAVKRIQNQFLGHILRRTTNSRNWKGKSLLKIPPYKEIIGVLTLTEREMEILAQRAKDAKAKYVYCMLSGPCFKCYNIYSSVMSANESGKFQTTVRVAN